MADEHDDLPREATVRIATEVGSQAARERWAAVEELADRLTGQLAATSPRDERERGMRDAMRWILAGGAAAVRTAAPPDESNEPLRAPRKRRRSRTTSIGGTSL